MGEREVFQKAKRFVYQNARPLDLARWRYHFEGGTAEEVLEILAMYQKEDGGFGYALEPDNWNPDSTPVATWTAVNILRELNVTDRNNPIVEGILNYLGSGKDFAEGKWYNTVAANNGYPHAVWWSCPCGTGMPDDNPTVSLAGFLLRFSEENSPLHETACGIVKKAVSEFMELPTEEMHTVKNFLELLLDCEEIENFSLFDLEAFREKVQGAVNRAVCREPEKWYQEYVFKPVDFFEPKCWIFEIAGKELCEIQADSIGKEQCADGSYPVTWQWGTDYKEYEISANWWRAALALNNMRYLKAMGKI